MRGGGTGEDKYTHEAAERSHRWAQPCDACRAAPSVVYCRADTAFLCASCDTQVHAANHVASRHERVRVCEVCERVPAALACRADAAVLCAVCDAQVHSANPLAGRHQRMPVLPLPAAAVPAASGLAKAASTATFSDKDEEADPWLLLNKDCNDHDNNNNNDDNDDDNNNNNNMMYGAEVDEYLDLVVYNSYYDNQNQEEQFGIQEQQQQQQKQRYEEKEGSECVVPLQVLLTSEQQQQQQGAYGIVWVEQEAPVTAGVSAYTASPSHRVSFSSMEVGIVPDTTMADTSKPQILTSGEASDLFSGPSLQMPLHFSSMDREARVLRYKEKKRTRKFEKTIRYASRKAYAEARPRIKGRFAKRSDMELTMDQMFSLTAISDDSYGTVPWS